MSYLISFIEDLIEDDKIKLEIDLRETLIIFIAAINDWPNEVHTLEKYLIEIQKLILWEPNNQTIKNAQELNITAWESESLAVLIDIYKYYDINLTLSEIIKDVENKLDNIFGNTPG